MIKPDEIRRLAQLHGYRQHHTEPLTIPAPQIQQDGAATRVPLRWHLDARGSLVELWGEVVMIRYSVLGLLMLVAGMASAGEPQPYARPCWPGVYQHHPGGSGQGLAPACPPNGSFCLSAGQHTAGHLRSAGQRPAGPAPSDHASDGANKGFGVRDHSARSGARLARPGRL